MRKIPHGRILKAEPKKQHLSTVPKFCSQSNTKYEVYPRGSPSRNSQRSRPNPSLRVYFISFLLKE